MADYIKLSILVTFYNQEEYVDQALQSIIDQKVNFKYEILIGDDGSSDGTHNKIQAWKTMYPDIIQYHIMDRDPKFEYNKFLRIKLGLFKTQKSNILLF